MIVSSLEITWEISVKVCPIGSVLDLIAIEFRVYCATAIQFMEKSNGVKGNKF